MFLFLTEGLTQLTAVELLFTPRMACTELYPVLAVASLDA